MTSPTGEGAGAPSAEAAGEVTGYAALRTGCVLADRSDRLRCTFAGTQAAVALNGLLTNDVTSLVPGRGQYAAALTVRGKVIADVRLFARQDDFLVDADARAAPGFWAMIRKYVNPRLARYADVTAELADLGVFGARARQVVARATGIPEATLAELPPYGHVTAGEGPAAVIAARVPDLGLEGYDLFVGRGEAAALEERLTSAGASRAGDGALELARIEAGRPRWGVDMDENTLAQEANLEELQAISFTKGCYTGQETVARVHFRGHVNRHLRGLVVDGAAPPAPGTAVVDAGGAPVGEVRSAARSPRLGIIALAMVRREVADGASLSVALDGAPATATVTALPFPA